LSWDLPADGPPGRQGLELAFGMSMRRTSAFMQLMSQAAAERIGINPTDLNCLNILSLGGNLTAGQLAQATGLTTASITGVIDRLEQAGYVTRGRDAHDRRRVVIHLIVEKVLADVVTVFAPLVAAWRETADGYTDAELEFVLRFQSRSEHILREHLLRLREPATAPPAAAPASPAT
jgi:DNA-binding transcriptional ArsR family regulator